MSTEPRAPRRRTVAEHQAAVRRLLAPVLAALGAEPVPFAGALNRVLASDLLAPIDLPPFDNSQMDGYAVRAADTGGRLPTVRTIAAGTSAAPLEPGHAAPIMTGAMLPAGADAVVPVEASEPAGFVAAGESVVLPVVPVGQFVRRAASDLPAGALALPQGSMLGPAQLGLLAALGLTEVPVRKLLRVAVLSTGDELVAPGGALGSGGIYDANGGLLAAALTEAGASVVHVPSVPDDPAELRRVLGTLKGIDLLISTGGISQGAFEVIKQTLAGSAEFHTVAMQPGGPQAIGTVRLGTGADEVPFLGFPGNPVSTLISFEMFLRPLLAGERHSGRAVLRQSVNSPLAKHQVRRAWYSNGTVELLGGPGSHLLHAMARANALVHLPVGVEEAVSGQEVEVWLL